MINSVSAVSFKAAAPAQSAQDRINAPGKFTKPDAQVPAKHEDTPKKKHVFLKALAGVVVAAIVVSGALIAAVRGGKLNVLDDVALKEAKFKQKIGHYLGKAGQWLDSNIWQRLTGAGKKAAEAVDEAAESGAKAGEKAADEAAEAGAKAGEKAAAEAAEVGAKAGEKAAAETVEAGAKAGEKAAAEAAEAGAKAGEKAAAEAAESGAKAGEEAAKAAEEAAK